MDSKTPLTPSLFEQYVRIAREQGVHAFTVGLDAVTVQFSPSFGTGTKSPTEPDAAVARGAWKRGPDLDRDPELDTEWD